MHFRDGRSRSRVPNGYDNAAVGGDRAVVRVILALSAPGSQEEAARLRDRVIKHIPASQAVKPRRWPRIRTSPWDFAIRVGTLSVGGAARVFE